MAATQIRMILTLGLAFLLLGCNSAPRLGDDTVSEDPALHEEARPAPTHDEGTADDPANHTADDEPTAEDPIHPVTGDPEDPQDSDNARTGNGSDGIGDPAGNGSTEGDDPRPGDLNGDGVVDRLDFQVFVDAFGTAQGDAGFDPSLDLDGDGAITLVDFQTWIGGIPEP